MTSVKKTELVTAAVLIVGVICILCITHFREGGTIPDNKKTDEITPPSETFYTPSEAESMILVKYPQAGDSITSPLKIQGEARGSWFFEATAPVMLVNWDGLIIAEGYIEAGGSWMTESFVPFTGKLKFTKPDYKDTGALIIQKSNPSGLHRNDAAIEIPIKFN